MLSFQTLQFMLTWEIKQLTVLHWHSHFQRRQAQQETGK